MHLLFEISESVVLQESQYLSGYLGCVTHVGRTGRMMITGKTRKLLWGSSGSRCAICKSELIIDATPQDDESVVGDECHIVSDKSNGPRYDPRFPANEINSFSNLILLCRVHYKMIDDQPERYTADCLRQLKANHEKWVAEMKQDLAKEGNTDVREGGRGIPFLNLQTPQI